MCAHVHQQHPSLQAHAHDTASARTPGAHCYSWYPSEVARTGDRLLSFDGGPCRRIAEHFAARGWNVVRDEDERGHLTAYEADDGVETTVHIVPVYDAERAALYVTGRHGYWDPVVDGPQEERRICAELELTQDDLWLKRAEVEAAGLFAC